MTPTPFLRYFAASIALERDCQYTLVIPVIDAGENTIVRSQFRLFIDEQDFTSLKYYTEGYSLTDKIAAFDLYIPELVYPGKYTAEIEVDLDIFGSTSLSLDVDLS